MKRIPLTQGQFALVDDEDFGRFGKSKWCAIWDPETKSYRAVRGVSKNGKVTPVILARVILGLTDPKIKADHENHDTLDCRRGNLRACSSSQNSRNRKGPRAGSFSGVRGVCWEKRCGKWRAQIFLNGKNKHLGLFVNINDAARAYADANRQHFGNFGGRI